MSKYLPKVSECVAFDGDMVRVSVNRISMKDAMTLRSGGDVSETMSRTEQLLRQYGVQFDGMKDANGADVPLDTILAEFYFHPLVTAAASLLMSTGDIPQEKLPPLGAPST